jgi:hypothetical protein
LLYRGPEKTLLAGAQVHHFILVVKRHEPDLAVRDEMVVDDPQTAPFPLASPAIPPTQLSEPASSGDRVSCLGIVNQVKLDIPAYLI